MRLVDRVDRDDLDLIRKLARQVGIEYAEGDDPDAVSRQNRLKIYGDARRAAAATGLDSLTLGRAGFFGNNVIQLVNAIMIAERTGIPLVRHEFPAFGPAPRGLPVRLQSGRAPRWRREVGLRGRFFLRYNNAILRERNAAEFMDVVDRYLRPAFRWGVAPEKGLLALNLRGGKDLFGRDTPPEFYGQPPLSFYIGAAEAAIAAHEIKRIAIVHQDELNPVLPALRDWARSTGLPLDCVSHGPEGDAKALGAAEHIVMGCTTFTEAVALLSKGLISIATFGRQHLVEPLDLGVPVRRRFEDDGTYKPAKFWSGSAAERAQMLDFPRARLTMTEGQGVAAAERRERLLKEPAGRRDWRRIWRIT